MVRKIKRKSYMEKYYPTPKSFNQMVNDYCRKKYPSRPIGKIGIPWGRFAGICDW